MKNRYEIKNLKGFDRMLFLSNTIFENNLKLFTDLISNKTGVAAENWLIRKCKRIDGINLLGHGFIRTLYNMETRECLDFICVADEQDIDFANRLMVEVFKVDQPPYILHQPKPPFNKIVMLDITPVPKPAWHKSNPGSKDPGKASYRSYIQDLPLIAANSNFKLPIYFRVTYYVPITKSESKKRKLLMHNGARLIKPDVTNYTKGFEDILLPEGDHEVWNVHQVKRHTIGNGDGTGGYIIVEYGIDD